MYFASDNGTGASEKILAALNDAMRSGPMSSYGADPLTQSLTKEFSALFEHEVEVFLLTSGTAANALAIAHVTPPWGAVFAHEEAHIVTSECGAPEFFSGARMVALPGSNGKLNAQVLQSTIASMRIEDPHGVRPACISVTNLSESGTLYLPQEIQAISTIARQGGMKLHLDGARFANAVVASGYSPAELSWKSGVDVMSLGATKNGALAAEAVIFFDTALAKDFKYRRMRAGHLISKHRFIAAQFLAWLKDSHWLELAAHANAQAKKLAEGLANAGIELAFPCEGNEILAYLPSEFITTLRTNNVMFYEWTSRNSAIRQPENTQLTRFVCAFNTPEEDIDDFIKLIPRDRQTKEERLI